MSSTNRKESQRALATYRPMNLFDIWSDLDREMWDSWRPFTFHDRMVPRTDVYEEKDELVVKAELPGIDRENVDINLDGDLLTIKAEKKEETKEDKKLHTRERYYGQYLRSFTLPYPVEQEKITASMDKGVLEIRLPKAEEAKAKKIEIKALAH